jgi:predicted outer membrane repeat protein
MRVEHCVFTANVADNGGAIAGGAVSFMTISGCVFNGNKANNDGGAVAFTLSKSLTLHQSQFMHNTATGGDGGAVQYGDSCTNVTVHECIFDKNKAALTGGAISFTSNIAYVSVLYSNFTHNRAVNESGGALYFSQSCSYISIGGMMPVIKEESQTSKNAVFDAPLFAYPVEYFILTFDAKTVVSCSADYMMVGKQDGFTRDNNGYGDLIFPRTYPEDAKYDGYTEDGQWKEDVNATDNSWRRERAKVNFIGGNLVEYYPTYADLYYDGKYTCKSGYNDALDWPGINGHDPFKIVGVYTTLVSNIVSDVGYVKLALFPVPQESAHACQFVGNTAGHDGGAVHFSLQNANIFVMRGTVFRNNQAGGVGGAIGFDYLNGYIYLYAAVFSGNRAGSTGGAVSLSKLNFPVKFFDASFVGNTAVDGGAVFLGDGNGDGLLKSITPYVVSFTRTVMTGNHASRHGGSVYLANINAARFEGLVVFNSTAGGSGGWAYLDSKNYLLLNGASLSHSTASVNGGALYAFIQNSVNFTGNCSVAASRSVEDGGAVRLELENSLASFGGLSLTDNACTGPECSGGGLSCSAASSVALMGPTMVSANTATLLGGGLVMSDSSLYLGSAKVSFVENAAVEGSALYLGSSGTSKVQISHSLNTSAVQFVRNRCTRHGGTVSWVKDPASAGHPESLFDRHTPGYNRVVWVDNIAPFGAKVATQPTFLNVSETLISVLTYDSLGIRPTPRLTLFDQFGNQNTSDYTTVVSVAV